MRCWDIWRCWGPIKKHVPVESVSIDGWEGWMTFEWQLEPYDVTYSINVSPEGASNRDVTITTSDASIISVVSYDSTSVTFSIAWSWNATVTVVSQDNADILATYSVEVTPAEVPFSPNNNILVEPTRGSARVKFFPVDENDENYVYGEVSDARNLVSIAYYWNCDNELCRDLFSNNSTKKELAKQISYYIDDYWIPASWAFEFSSETWAVFESYFNWEASTSDVRMAIRESELKPADSCPVTIADVATDEVTIQFWDATNISFMVSYDCTVPDYSNLYVTSSNTSVCSVELRTSGEYLRIISHGYWECTLTFWDWTTEYTIPVTVPRPVLESITIDTGWQTEVEVWKTANFSVNLSPEWATANLVPYWMYTEWVDANVTYTDGSWLDVEALAVSNIEVWVEDTITWIQSGAVELSLVEAQPHIEFDIWHDEPNTWDTEIDFFPCRYDYDCWCFDDECSSTWDGFFGATGYIVDNLWDWFIEFYPKDIVEWVDPNSFTFYINDYRDDQDYWWDFVVTVSYDWDLCNELPIEYNEFEEPNYVSIWTVAAIYKENDQDEWVEIWTLTLNPGNFEDCNWSWPWPLFLPMDICWTTYNLTDSGDGYNGGACYDLVLNRDDPLYQEIIDNWADASNIITVEYEWEWELEVSLPQLEQYAEYEDYYFPFCINSEEPVDWNLIFTYNDGRQQSVHLNIIQNHSNDLRWMIQTNLSYETLKSYNDSFAVRDSINVSISPEDYIYSYIQKEDENVFRLYVTYLTWPEEYYVFLLEPDGWTFDPPVWTYTIHQEEASGGCPE